MFRGCGHTELVTIDLQDEPVEQSLTARPRSTPAWAVSMIGMLALLLAAGAGFFGGRVTVSAPNEDSAEAGFARDMATHHEQAVEMALLITDRSTNPRILTLARDIAFTQQNQIGQMRGWLDVWGLPATGLNLPMTWMGHTSTGLMPGMATRDELAALQQATGTEADRRFLTLMVEHHEGALPMAQALLDRSDNEPVRRLAHSILTSQQAEIELMQSMLEQMAGEAESLIPATPEAN